MCTLLHEKVEAQGDDAVLSDAACDQEEFQKLQFFFFQAEDGIRDLTVTGVQTCALPICRIRRSEPARRHLVRFGNGEIDRAGGQAQGAPDGLTAGTPGSSTSNPPNDLLP